MGMQDDIQDRLDYVEVKTWSFRGDDDDSMVIMDTKLEDRFGPTANDGNDLVEVSTVVNPKRKYTKKVK